MSTLGLSFVVDTNLIGDEGAAVVALRQMWEDGWIELTRTDTVDTELSQRKDPAHRAELLNESAAYVEHLGPMMLGHSRLESCVLAGDSDTAIWDRLWTAMFPGLEVAAANRRQVRDAKHAHTAMRYGADALVTLDEKLQRKAGAVKAEFNDFSIMSPEVALAFARRLRAREEYRRQNPLPE